MKKLLFTIALLILSMNLYSQMTFNSAYNFNGSSYYAVPHAADLATLTTQATWEFWINPTNHGLRIILGKNYITGWVIGTQADGRIALQIPGGIVSTTTTLPLGVWTHVAVTYNSGTTTIYFNGTSQTTTGTASGSIGSNTDSLYIGCDRESGLPAYFINAMLDNIRIWNVARTAAQIQDIRFTPVQMPGVNLGPFTGLVFSVHGDLLTTADYSGPNTSTMFNRGVTLTSYSQRPVHYNDYNSNFYFDGTSYLSVQNVAEANVISAITVECWIKRDTTGTQPTFQNIFNKSGSTNRYNWALYINSAGTLFFSLNSDAGLVVSSSGLINRSRWYHIAGTWSQSSGQMKLYVNGDSVATATFAGPIANDPDSICIGGIAATDFIANKFKGQIDNPRIWSVARTTQEIRAGMYVNNSPAAGTAPYNNLEFSFDALTCMPRIASANSYYVLPMAFRGNGIRLVSSHLNNNAFLTSPIIRDNGLFEMPNISPNWFLSTKRAYLPDPGMYMDSVLLPATDGTTKVLVLLNHTWISDMILTLRDPSGIQVVLTPLYTHGANDMMVIFDQGADSIISTFSGQAPYSPLMRPANPLTPLTGPKPAGWWRLTFNDGLGADQGYINGWGVYRGTIVGNGNITELPNKFYLSQNYPNPFNPVTTIKYGLAKDVMVKITIYDITGREVKVLANEFKKAGEYEINFDGTNLASGTYFYRLEAGDFAETKKMILIK